MERPTLAWFELLSKTLIWAAGIVLTLSLIIAITITTSDNTLPFFEDLQRESRGIAAIGIFTGGLASAGVLSGLGAILRMLVSDRVDRQGGYEPLSSAIDEMEHEKRAEAGSKPKQKSKKPKPKSKSSARSRRRQKQAAAESSVLFDEEAEGETAETSDAGEEADAKPASRARRGGRGRSGGRNRATKASPATAAQRKRRSRRSSPAAEDADAAEEGTGKLDADEAPELELGLDEQAGDTEEQTGDEEK